MPVIGCHSVILNPDCVKRVIPPNRICIIIIRTPANSHLLTFDEESFLNPLVIKPEFCCKGTFGKVWRIKTILLNEMLKK